MEKIKNTGKLVFGPYAADSFFASSNYKNFDAILAAYHDQGLIPFKTLSFGQGVNFTAGLNKVRTSPDHGTARGRGYRFRGTGADRSRNRASGAWAQHRQQTKDGKLTSSLSDPGTSLRSRCHRAG